QARWTCWLRSSKPTSAPVSSRSSPPTAEFLQNIFAVTLGQIRNPSFQGAYEIVHARRWSLRGGLVRTRQELLYSHSHNFRWLALHASRPSPQSPAELPRQP